MLRRLLRASFAGLAGLSLLLLLLTLVIWGRGKTRVDTWSVCYDLHPSPVHTGYPACSVLSLQHHQGKLRLVRYSDACPPRWFHPNNPNRQRCQYTRELWARPGRPWPPLATRWGLGYAADPSGRQNDVRVHATTLTLLLAGLPLCWIGNRLLLRRPRGLCLTCAYDLRASKDACPECGAPIPQRER